MSLAANFPLTPTIQKFFPELAKAGNKKQLDKAIVDFINEKNEDIAATISTLSSHIEILNHQKERTSLFIALLEELGGLTVRARNLLSSQRISDAISQGISEFEEIFRGTLIKLNKTSEESVINGINLMAGDTLETTLDKKGQNSLKTPGIKLTSEELGIRPPHFETEFSTQNSRIDVMNALDVVVSLRNTITARLDDLKTAHEFAIHTLEHFRALDDKLSESGRESEIAGLQKLLTLGPDILNGEDLAEPAQKQILEYFTTSPNMEDK